MLKNQKMQLAGSVEPLKTLYAVIVALALTKGIELFLVPADVTTGFRLDGLKERKIDEWIVFAVFVVTLVRFFHGAVRHLHVRYKDQAETIKHLELSALFDFALLSLEGILFLTLAHVQQYLGNFILVYIILLTVDVAWAQTALWTSFGGKKFPGYLRVWRNNNTWAVVALLGLVLLAPKSLTSLTLSVVFAMIILLNSLVDYWKALRFYFPGTQVTNKQSEEIPLQVEPTSMEVVFLAGPYRGKRGGKVEFSENIKKAESVAIEVWRLGAACICPHKNTAFFGGKAPDDVWLSGSQAILRRCDAVLMIEGWRDSEGAKAEHALAQRLDKPVFYTLGEVQAWIKQSK